MRVACLRPRPPAPGKWIPGIYEVPPQDFYSFRFPRVLDRGVDGYYYDKTPWGFYKEAVWHLLVETTHEYVLTDILPRRRGWVLVIDSMWWQRGWIPLPHWDLFAVSADGIIE